MKRHILAITGSRAEYGLSKSIFRAIQKHPKLKLSLVVTGTHLLKEYGYTLREIEKDGFRIADKIKINYNKSDGGCMAEGIGKQIKSLVDIINRENPNIILVITDLGHVLAGAIVGAHMNIPVAHVHGGDVSGTIDESIRHATTKFSHIHFAATEKSAERLIKIGEEPWRVHVVGAPGLDNILNAKVTEPLELKERFDIDLDKPLLMVVQHPVTTECDYAGRQMKETINAIKELKHQTLVGYPNKDAGSRYIEDVIKENEKVPFIRTYKNIPREDYLGLMKIASVLIGNSSSGIIEAPSFGLPVVNIGTRQQGRERAANVIDVDYNKDKIVDAIKKALYDKEFLSQAKNCKSPYGDGYAGERLADILSKIEINQKLLQKKISY